MYRIFASLVAIAAGLAAWNCQKETRRPPEPPPVEITQPPAPAPTAAAPVEEAGAPGNIRVVVSVEGTVAAPKELNRNADPYCAKTKKLDPSALVKDGKVENAVVRVAGKVRGTFTTPAEPVKITQNECMYSPRVSAAMQGQEIQIANSDKTLHNVHAYLGEEKENWFNSAQPPNAPEIKRNAEDGLISLKCDVHPWMASYVAVAEHPFVGVSGANGVVELKNVPSSAKPYKLEIWHESFGKLVQDVTVQAGQTAQVSVTFKPAG